MEPVGAAPYWRAVIHTREKRFFSPTKKDLEPVSPYIFIYIYIWQHAPVPSSVNLDRRRRTRASEICSRWKNQFVDRAASFWFPLQEYRYHYSWLAFFLYDLEEIWYRCPRFLFPRSFFFPIRLLHWRGLDPIRTGAPHTEDMGVPLFYASVCLYGPTIQTGRRALAILNLFCGLAKRIVNREHHVGYSQVVVGYQRQPLEGVERES